MTNRAGTGAGFLPALEGLRGLAALIVCLYHLRHVPALQPLTDATPFLFTKGWIFVDLFFAISGFVLGLVYYERLRGNFAGVLKPYFVARVARIYPLFLATSATFVAIVLVNGGGEAMQLVGTFLRQSLLAFTWGPLAERPLVPPSWSVSAEFLLYLLFPLIVASGALRNRSMSAALLLAALGIYVGLVLVTGGFYKITGLAPVRAFGGFLFGLCLWRLSTFGWEKLGFAAIGAMMICAIAMENIDLTLLATTFIVLWLATTGQRHLAAFFCSVPMLWLGRVSYSVYLWHWFGILHLKSMDPADGLAFNVGYTLAILVAVLLVSEVSYRYFEAPARQAIRNAMSQKPNRLSAGQEALDRQ